MNIQVSLVVYI